MLSQLSAWYPSTEQIGGTLGYCHSSVSPPSLPAKPFLPRFAKGGAVQAKEADGR